MKKVKHTFIFESDADALALKLQNIGIKYEYERGYNEFHVTHDIDIKIEEKHKVIYLISDNDTLPIYAAIKNKFMVNTTLSRQVQHGLGL